MQKIARPRKMCAVYKRAFAHRQTVMRRWSLDERMRALSVEDRLASWYERDDTLRVQAPPEVIFIDVDEPAEPRRPGGGPAEDVDVIVLDDDDDDGSAAVSRGSTRSAEAAPSAPPESAEDDDDLIVLDDDDAPAVSGAWRRAVGEPSEPDGVAYNEREPESDARVRPGDRPYGSWPYGMPGATDEEFLRALEDYDDDDARARTSRMS